MSKKFNCPRCGAHELKAKVTFVADVKKFDQEGSFFMLGKELEPEDVRFLCLDCGWETVSPTFEQDL
jgi:transcription elongation factor Elf1